MHRRNQTHSKISNSNDHNLLTNTNLNYTVVNNDLHRIQRRNPLHSTLRRTSAKLATSGRSRESPGVAGAQWPDRCPGRGVRVIIGVALGRPRMIYIAGV